MPAVRRVDSAGRSNRQRIGRRRFVSRIFYYRVSQRRTGKRVGGGCVIGERSSLLFREERLLRAEYEPRRNKDVARDQTKELAVSSISFPRSRNKPAIIRLGELQLRLARRGLVASCMHWNPFPDGGKLMPAVKTFSAPRTAIRRMWIPVPWEPVAMRKLFKQKNRSYEKKVVICNDPW